MGNASGRAADQAARALDRQRREAVMHDSALLGSTLAKNAPSHIRAQLFAKDDAALGAGSPLNVKAALCRHLADSLAPLVHSARGDFEHSGHFGLAAEDLAGPDDRESGVFHAETVAPLHAKRKALLSACFDSIAQGMKIWTPEEEAERLAARFESVNQSQFAAAHKVPGGASMITQHKTGNRPIAMAAAVAYARGFKVSLEEISPRLALQARDAAGAITPAKTESAVAQHSAVGVDVIDLDDNEAYPGIPLVTFKLSAGATGFGVSYMKEDAEPIVFRREWYQSRSLDPAKLYAVRVSGSSMEPGLWDGDTVVVDTGSVVPRDGLVFAVNYEGELVIKRLVRDGGQWWLQSDNPDQTRYPRKICHSGVQLVGLIVHKQSERI